MGFEKNDNEEKKYFEIWKCHKCGFENHLEQKYCRECGSDLWFDGTFWTTPISRENNNVMRINIDDTLLSCKRCGKRCDYCAGHGYDRLNNEGFGGEKCFHRKNIVRCHCCQEIHATVEICTP